MEFFDDKGWEMDAFDTVAPEKEPAPRKSIFDALDTPEALPIRQNFPDANTSYQSGESDGFVYESIFAGGNLVATYEMICEFLKEEGYNDIPLPKNIDELEKFRIPTRNKQILLFEDNGYVHNPIKILFPLDARQKRTLILKIYNESAPDHLLRFHKKL